MILPEKKRRAFKKKTYDVASYIYTYIHPENAWALPGAAIGCKV
jgi:hypothetical protein